MALSVSFSHPTTALLDVEPDVSRLACPLCHTMSRSLTDDALAAGEDWRCGRCGQLWNARRTTTVAVYAVWSLELEARRRTAAGQRVL